MTEEMTGRAPDRRAQVEALLRARFESEDEQTSFLVDLLLARKNVVLYGPPGTGKTRAAMMVGDDWERRNGPGSVFPVTFHPSYSYEDFVEGYRPVGGSPGVYGLQDGVLLEACNEAQRRATATADAAEPTSVLLLVDEINRGDVARIFGELITYIEPDKRDRPFSLAQSPTKRRSIPANLCVLGTMNTADKSISLLDVALRRRFAFLEFRPESGSYASATSWAEEVGGVPVGAILDGLNERLRREGIEPERSVGQALLSVRANAPDPIAELQSRFRFDVQPLIEEYCYGDRERAKRILGDYVDPRGLRRDLTAEEFVRVIAAIAEDAADWHLARTADEPTGPAPTLGIAGPVVVNNPGVPEPSPSGDAEGDDQDA